MKKKYRTSQSSKAIELFKFSILLMCFCSATQANSNQICGNNLMAAKLIEIIKSHENQQRNHLKCSSKLTEIAKIKAGLIIENQNIWHDAGHMTPNQLLRHNGFKLPTTYPIFGNQVEALAGGEEDAEAVFKDFINSPPHKKLLLGENTFFKSQNQIGAVFVEDLSTDHQYYWVVIIADEKIKNTKQMIITNESLEPKTVKKKRNRGREIKEKMYRRKAKQTQYQ